MRQSTTVGFFRTIAMTGAATAWRAIWCRCSGYPRPTPIAFFSIDGRFTEDGDYEERAIAWTMTPDVGLASLELDFDSWGYEDGLITVTSSSDDEIPTLCGKCAKAGRVA
jgi:hypothetical protein